MNILINELNNSLIKIFSNYLWLKVKMIKINIFVCVNKLIFVFFRVKASRLVYQKIEPE